MEYEDKTSPAIDVAFAAVDKTKVLAAFGVDAYQAPVSMVIWTTTPWTLPANRALSLSPDLDYVLVEIESEDGAKQAVILAEALVESCITRYGVKSHQILGRAKGAELELMQFQHPFYDFSVPAILGDHVTTESGTGVVHTAPGHGQDDFVVGQMYGLEVANPVGDNGVYKADTPLFAGKHVFKANDEIVALLQEKDVLLHREAIVTAIHTAGATRLLLFSAPHRSGLSPWITKGCVLKPWVKSSKPSGSLIGDRAGLRRWSRTVLTGVSRAAYLGRTYHSVCSQGNRRAASR